jgi:hypothetical protein
VENKNRTIKNNFRKDLEVVVFRKINHDFKFIIRN